MRRSLSLLWVLAIPTLVPRPAQALGTADGGGSCSPRFKDCRGDKVCCSGLTCTGAQYCDEGPDTVSDGGAQFWCELEVDKAVEHRRPPFFTRCSASDCSSSSLTTYDGRVESDRSCNWNETTGRLTHRETLEPGPIKLEEAWYASGVKEYEQRYDVAAIFRRVLRSQRRWYPTGVVSAEWPGGAEPKRSFRPDGCLFQVAREVDAGVDYELASSDCHGDGGGTTLVTPPLGLSRISYVSSFPSGNERSAQLEGPQGQKIELTGRSVCLGRRCFTYSSQRRASHNREYIVAWAASGLWALVMNDGPDRSRPSTRPADSFPERVDVLFDFTRNTFRSGQFRPAGGDWVEVLKLDKVEWRHSQSPTVFLHVPSGTRRSGPCSGDASWHPLSGDGNEGLCLTADGVERVHGKRRERCATKGANPFLSPLGPSGGWGFSGVELPPFFRLSGFAGGAVCDRVLEGVSSKAKGADADWEGNDE